MVKKRKVLYPALVLFFLTAFLMPLRAAGAGSHVFDTAGLFSDAETRRMEETAVGMEEKYRMNILMLTTDDAKGRTSAEVAEDFYESGGYDQNGKKGGIVLIIDMDNRELNLVTAGNMIYFITDAREERIYDAGYGAAGGGLYGAAMIDMLEQTEYYLKSGIPDNQYTYDASTGEIVRYRSLSLSEVLLAAGAALLLASLCCMSVKRRYRTVQAYQYAPNQNVQIDVTDREDRLVNEFVTSTHIPTAPPPSGRGGRTGGSSSGRTTVHHSSGGGRYGGGHGRKF